MRIAVLSDIHANTPALRAVLAKVEALAPDRIICLGDLVGYNAQPRSSIRLIRKATEWVVAGNHDWEAIQGQVTQGTSSAAQQIMAWTRNRLRPPETVYLSELPCILIEPGVFVAVHGCYMNSIHINGYVTGTMLEANLEAIARNPNWPKLAFCGHTHVPMCGWLEGENCVEKKLRDRLSWPHWARAVLINPGSVGQPRDGDPRAAFALVDTTAHSVELHRVPYPIQHTVRMMKRAQFPEALIDRLERGE
ncbi:MAG: metallophosphatase family protein [Blastocatellia bacterium]|nr:metallophosphatase family protein [Blastocatellia bacterium]